MPTEKHWLCSWSPPVQHHQTRGHNEKKSYNEEARTSGYEGGLNSKMAANSDVIEYPLAMLWRHRPAFTIKLTGFETTIVITRTILTLNSWNFLITSIILLLKLLMSCNNSLRVTVLSLWRSKYRKLVSL